MSFQTFERAFLPLKNAKIHIKIDLQMATISLFKWLVLYSSSRSRMWQTKKTKTINFSFSHRRAAADLHQLCM